MPQLKIDASHSVVSFVVRHMGFSKVRGTFGTFEGEINFDPENTAASTVSVAIDADSVSTRDEKRDAHLRTNDFFGTETNPTITFVSTGVQPDGDDLKIAGELTMNGITKPVTLDAEFNGKGASPFGFDVYSFSAETKINRKDFGVNWNAALETGGFLVSDDVKIELEIEAIPA